MSEFICMRGEPALSAFRLQKLQQRIFELCGTRATPGARFPSAHFPSAHFPSAHFMYLIEASETLSGEKVCRLSNLLQAAPEIDAIFRDRYSFQLSFVRNRVVDQLIQIPLAGFYGYEFQWQNAGTVEGNSVEATFEDAEYTVHAHPTLAEGLRMELLGKPIEVSVIYPGYIRSEMNEKVKNAPFMVSTEKGVHAMVEAIEKGKAHAEVPAWPWVPLGYAIRNLPLSLVRKMMG